MSSMRAHELVNMQNVRDFPQTKLDSEIISPFLLRYHGRWIFKKNAKNIFFAVQIEKTEKNNLQKEWRKKLFYFLR